MSGWIVFLAVALSPVVVWALESWEEILWRRDVKRTEEDRHYYIHSDGDSW